MKKAIKFIGREPWYKRLFIKRTNLEKLYTGINKDLKPIRWSRLRVWFSLRSILKSQAKIQDEISKIMPYCETIHNRNFLSGMRSYMERFEQKWDCKIFTPTVNEPSFAIFVSNIDGRRIAFNLNDSHYDERFAEHPEMCITGFEMHYTELLNYLMLDNRLPSSRIAKELKQAIDRKVVKDVIFKLWS